MALRKKGDAQRQAAGRKVKCEGEMEKVGEEQRKKPSREKNSKETRKGREAGRKMTGEGGEEHKRECRGGRKQCRDADEEAETPRQIFLEIVFSGLKSPSSCW